MMIEYFGDGGYHDPVQKSDVICSHHDWAVMVNFLDPIDLNPGEQGEKSFNQAFNE